MTKHHNSYLVGTISMLLALFLFLVLPGIVNSQVVGKGYNNSLIYKIRSDTNTVYIVGSLHALAEEFYPLTRAFSYAYYNSQKIIMEVDPEILASAEGQKYVDKVGTFSNGMTLKKALSPKTYTLLKKHMKTLEADIRDIQKLKPWMVYLAGGGGVLDATKDFRKNLGVESHFYQMAKDSGKLTGGLETLEEHFNVFDKLSLKDQDIILRESLKKSLQDKKSEEHKFIKMVTSWHQGDLQGLEKAVENYKSNPIFYNALLVRRNHNWVPQIEEFLKDTQNYFVVVGVAHLAGEDGLLNLLTEKGYELERVSYVMP